MIGQCVIGNPDETLETVSESIKFIKESQLSKALRVAECLSPVQVFKTMFRNVDIFLSNRIVPGLRQ